MDISTLTIKEKRKLAAQKETGRAELELLGREPDEAIRRLVAAHPNTSEETLTALSQGDDGWVIFWLCRNPNTPYKTWVYLSNHSKWWVRGRVAKSRLAPTEIIKELYKSDKNGCVRASACLTLSYRKNTAQGSV